MLIAIIILITIIILIPINSPKNLLENLDFNIQLGRQHILVLVGTSDASAKCKILQML